MTLEELFLIIQIEQLPHLRARLSSKAKLALDFIKLKVFFCTMNLT
jgi:hypothetical protein